MAEKAPPSTASDMSNLAIAGLVLQLVGTAIAGWVLWANWRKYRLPQPPQRSALSRAKSWLVSTLRRPREVQVGAVSSASATDSYKVEITRGEPGNATEAIMRVLEARYPSLTEPAHGPAHRELLRRVDELAATVERNQVAARAGFADYATGGVWLQLLGLAMVIAGSILSAIG